MGLVLEKLTNHYHQTPPLFRCPGNTTENMVLFSKEHKNDQVSASDSGDGELIKPPEEAFLAVPLHPLGIKPAGNSFTASSNIKSAAGFFSILSDETILQIVESLQAAALLRLGATCKALYAFCHFDELWKTLYIGYVLCLTSFILGIFMVQPQELKVIAACSCWNTPKFIESRGGRCHCIKHRLDLNTWSRVLSIEKHMQTQCF